MSIRLTFLGTGGAFTDFRVNYHNNAVVHTSEGPVLIDCGGTAAQSLKELGIPVWDVAGVIVTHMHGDHIGGLEQLLWERYYTGPQRFLRTKVLATAEVHAALRRCLHDCVDEYTNRNGVTMPGGYDALVQAVIAPENLGFVVGDVSFALARTPHVVGPDVDKPSFGVRLFDDECAAYYTSDTTFRPEIGALYPGRIFHDCTFAPHYKGTVHTHYSELLTLPPEVRKEIVLMHHTTVPDGVDVVADGFAGAASKHATYDIR